MGRFFAPLGVALALTLLFMGGGWSGNYFSSFDLESTPLEQPGSSQQCNSTRDFKWEEIEPKSELAWVDCFELFTCARLEVPLNYSDPEGAKAIIALIRLASPLEPSSPDYAGPILYNPGGPGGSGVDFLRGFGPQMRVIVGPTFDLVSFDPRGVAATQPRANFFTTEVERQLWMTGTKNAIPESQIPGSWAHYQLLSPLIEEQNRAGNDYLKHINTENTARDMLYITEKYGYEKLKYMGYSYGTILGSTFASLFPDKIERMIIDGVMDADTYYDATWNKNLLDIEATMQSFFDGCYAAEPTGCPFWMPSPTLIKEELDRLYSSVREAPIPVRLSSGSYGVVDYELLRVVVFRALYKPWGTFPKLAQALQDLKNGDGTTIFAMSDYAQTQVTCSCDANQYTFTSVLDASNAIACNDAFNVAPNLDAFLTFSKKFRELYPWADTWDRHFMQCAAYPGYEKTHFQRPVGATNTSFPILFISNTADPVTPLLSAKKIQKRFGSSALLTQNSPGHCSLSAPSICTAKIVREYMTEGKLPEEGTVCQVDSPIFPSFFDSMRLEELQQRAYREEMDKGLLDALLKISQQPKSVIGYLGI
ncbi:TAP-like protein-domain-containing protein [Flagelloscypha sp. PMI_526]|nr:TAP-like protein-domain-containing protein [Flagelloscypha sp. PMI_526]